MKATCIDDTQTIRHGFLWLKKRKEKDPRITSGKVYQVIGRYVREYGNSYIPCTFVHLLVLDDRGVPQLFELERFKEVVKHE